MTVRAATAFTLLALGCSSTVGPLPSGDAGALGSDVTRGPDAQVAGDVAPVDAVLPPRDVPVRPDVSEPPTECALENDGRACAAPGMGCAAAGGGCGASSFRCECGADLRWACEVRTNPSCDGGTVTPADVTVVPPTDAGACNVVGVWTVTIDRTTAYFSFEASTWRVALTLDGLRNPIASGTWSWRGDTIALREDAGGMMTGCLPEDLGVYRPTFDPSCNALRLALVSDECAERGQGLSGWSFARR